MGAELWLDENYNSGIPGHPGAQFVVNLNMPSVPSPELEQNCNGLEKPNDSGLTPSPPTISSRDGEDAVQELPETLSVLFVDNDFILRKLYSRLLKTVAPGWTIREAANDETALKLTDTEHFDLIFMDMYMAI
jgi:hypothetical protein